MLQARFQSFSSLGHKIVRLLFLAKQPIYYENAMLKWDLLGWRWIIVFVFRDNSLLDTIAKILQVVVIAVV
jgi:hypothetical protein